MNLLNSLPGSLSLLSRPFSLSFTGSSRTGSRLLTLSALALLAVGCGGQADTPVTFAELKPLIRTSCALSASCHGASSAYSGSLSLTEADAYCSLVGATQGATYRQAAKAQYPHRVVAKDKANSFLYQKLILSTANSGSTKPLGMVMPLNQPLDTENIDLFARWIDGGAQNDSGTPAPAGCN